MTAQHIDGVAACGARPGDVVRCIRQRDDTAPPRFIPGQCYQVVAGADGSPRIRSRMPTNEVRGKKSDFLHFGYGWFFEVC